MHFTRFISTDRPHCKDEPGTDLQQTISDRHLGDSASVFGLYGAIQMLLLLLLLLNSLICMPGCRMKDDSCRATRMQLLKNSNSMTGSDGWIATKTLAIKDIINFVVFLISNFSFRYSADIVYVHCASNSSALSFSNFVPPKSYIFRLTCVRNRFTVRYFSLPKHNSTKCFEHEIHQIKSKFERNGDIEFSKADEMARKVETTM